MWESRQGRQKLSQRGQSQRGMLAKAASSVAPDGALAVNTSLIPPLKRWAIVGCPWRDKER